MAEVIHTAIFFIFIWMLAAMTPDVSPFILDAQKCVAFPPCTCLGPAVDCISKSLTTMPKFEVSNVTGSNLNMYLFSNQLTSIPANAFQNLTVPNNTNVNLRLDFNHLNNIASNAFVGIANTMIYLNLENNNLTSLPSELTTLSKLQMLNIQNNPISSLNPSIMRTLGRHLTGFALDLKHYSTWPSELNLLTSLTSLYVSYPNANILDYDLFDTFKNTLTTLSIEKSLLARMPAAICHLSNLQSITFKNNPRIHVNSTILEPCNRKLTSVRTVDLSGNNLRYIPDVFHSFPSMTSLTLSYNKLPFVHWNTIPSNYSLTHLYAYNNDFTRIPTALGKLRYLNQLNMGRNKITSLEDTDLNHFSHLSILWLTRNPLQYISPNAFKHNPVLKFVYLENTLLRQLPTSIRLHNIGRLYLSDSPIECNCDMSFLKLLNVTRIDIRGNCHKSPLSIKTYLKEDLPNCP